MEKVRVFAASPADVSKERAKVDSVADALKPLADHLDIVLDVRDWRAVVPDMGRPEQVILDQLGRVDWVGWIKYGVARIPEAHGELGDARRAAEEAAKIFQRLGRQRSKLVGLNELLNRLSGPAGPQTP